MLYSEQKPGAVQWIISEGWSFAETEGILLIQYYIEAAYPGAEDYSLSGISYWTLNQDIEVFNKLLNEINQCNLPVSEGTANQTFTIADVWPNRQESRISLADMVQPYLPSNMIAHCPFNYYQNLQGESVALSPRFFGANEAVEALSWIWKEDETLNFGNGEEVYSAVQIHFLFQWDL